MASNNTLGELPPAEFTDRDFRIHPDIEALLSNKGARSLNAL